MLLENTERTLATLRKLRELGVRISMDDFGTGYSSLSNLRLFPFDKIKIDKSFIHGLETDQQSGNIIEAVAALGRRLGMTITAEGVETSTQLEQLRALDVTEVQGNFIGRPAAAEHIPATLAAITKGKRAA